MFVIGSTDAVLINHGANTVLTFIGTANVVGYYAWARIQWDGATYQTIGFSDRVTPNQI